MILPQARNRNIVVQTLGKEVLIYNLDSHRAFNLNETSAVVFNHCDGATTFQELKRKYRFTDDLINFALDELQSNDLLDGERIAHFAGVSRREVIRRVGLASLVALPVVAGLVAPNAVHAASGCAGGCNLPNASASCVGGSCQINSCNAGFANCNGSQADGCEANTTNSVSNCGGCGNACIVANGTPACVNSACQIASCNSGFANCNNNPADGCETNLRTSNANCGACGFPCPNGQTCQNSACL